MRKSTLLMTVAFCICLFLGGYFDKAGAQTVKLIKDGDLFPETSLQVPKDAAEREYLGLPEGETFTLSRVKADLVLVEILSVYCYSCKKQAPVYNQLFKLIESVPATKGRIKIIGIAAGNGDLEVKDFRETNKVPFPVIPDPYFEMHKAIGGSRTPFSIYVRQDSSGRPGITAGTHLGPNLKYRQVFADLGILMNKEIAAILKESQNKTGEVVTVKAILSEKERQAKARKVFATFAGEVKNFQKISLKNSSRSVYTCVIEHQGKSRRFFAEVISRAPACVDCHDTHFIYAFDAAGQILRFEPLQLTKYGNELWSVEDVAKMRRRVLGKSISKRLVFNPEVDAVSTATITSAAIFDSLSQGEMLLKELKEMGLI
jgi:hypothetical protein